MRFIHFVIGLCVLSFSLQNGSCGFIGDAVRQAVHSTIGVIKEIPKQIPNPNEIFEFGKSAVLGIPAELSMNVIHRFCSAIVNSQEISVRKRYTPKIEDLSFILRTTRADISVSLTNSTKLWTHPEFNPNLPLVIFVSGWKTDWVESENQKTFANAYLCRGNTNFVAMDTAAYIDTLYSWSALNTELIGQHISQALQSLIRNYPPSNIHCVGDSLGAHICGAAGRQFYKATGHMVRRITGLDPANPCFRSGSALTGLSRGDAMWVDIIHSNPGVAGKKDAIGDADFYPNGMSQLQPGTFDIESSHARAWHYYAETIYPGNENNFLARKCTSMKAVDKQNCLGPLYPMGYAAPFNLKGIFFLRTNSAPPYGKHSRKNYQPICAATNRQ